MRTSTWIAIGLTVAVAAWLASGLFIGGGDEEDEVASARPPQPTLVEVRTSTAEPVPQYIYAQGVAQPYRTVDVVSSTSGTLGEVPVQQGEQVEAGKVLARVRLEARESQLRSAEARAESLESDLEAARELEERGFATPSRVRELESQLEEARANLQSIRAEIRDTTIEAPIPGVVSEVFVNGGQTISAGTAIARIVDNTPLRATLDISQRDVGRVDVGRSAVVSFATGHLAKGRVCFVAPAADPETRTFRTEIRVPNESRDIPSVVSVEVRFQTGEADAHFVSPAILALSEDGTLGVKSVDEDGTVRFHPAEIVRTGIEGVWVGGLPDEVRLITTGQGFVREGERVRVREVQSEADDSGGGSEGGTRLPTATVEEPEFDGAEDIPEPPPSDGLCEGSAANGVMTSSVPTASSGTFGGGQATQGAGGSAGAAASPQAGAGSTGGQGEAGTERAAPSVGPISPSVPAPPIAQPQGGPTGGGSAGPAAGSGGAAGSAPPGGGAAGTTPASNGGGGG